MEDEVLIQIPDKFVQLRNDTFYLLPTETKQDVMCITNL